MNILNIHEMCILIQRIETENEKYGIWFFSQYLDSLQELKWQFWLFFKSLLCLMGEVNKIKLLSMESYRAFLKSQGTAGCGAASQHHLFFGFEMIYGNWSVHVFLLTVQLQQYVLRQQWKSKQIYTNTKVYSPEKVMLYIEYRNLYQ